MLHLNLQVCPALWLFTHAWFGKYWFIQLCKSPKCWHILGYHLKKTIFVKITNDPIRKIFMCWESCHVPGGRYNFSKNLIFAWKFQFYHWQQICQVFSLKHLVRFVHFKKMSTKYPTFSTRFVFQFIFHMRMISYGGESC